MASQPLLLLLFIALFSLGIAQQQTGDPDNGFYVPPPAEEDITIDPTVFSRNEAYAVGQPETFSWITNSQIISLVMYQQGVLPNKLVLAGI
jgi:hypothetical protein